MENQNSKTVRTLGKVLILERIPYIEIFLKENDKGDHNIDCQAFIIG